MRVHSLQPDQDVRRCWTWRIRDGGTIAPGTRRHRDWALGSQMGHSGDRDITIVQFGAPDQKHPAQSPWKLWPQRSELDQWSVWTWSGAWRCSTPSCRPPWGGTWTRARRCTTCRCSLSSSQTSSLINTVSLKCNKYLIRLCELPKLKYWVDYVSVMPMSQHWINAWK